MNPNHSYFCEIAFASLLTFELVLLLRMTEFKWLWRRRLNYSADSAAQMSWWFAETAFTDGTDRGKKVYALNVDRFLLSNLILHQLIDWQNNTAPWTLLVTRHLMRKSLNWLPGWPLASTDLLLLWALLGLAIWWHIWKCTLVKSQTNVISVIMHPLRQTKWKDIWKHTARKKCEKGILFRVLSLRLERNKFGKSD